MEATSGSYTQEHLEVPGATLYYEVRGAGPVLLMMPGGPADATTFRAIENELAARYTVVTYDPRGLSRSTLSAPFDNATMVETFADDAHRLLGHLTAGPADIFASSGGAVIALELIRRHADELGTVIIHEPPSPALVADPDATRQAMEAVCDTYAAAGLWPAVQSFMALIRVHGGPPQPEHQGEPSPQAQAQVAMMQANMEFFFGRYIRNIALYQPDLGAVRNASCRVVPAAGADSAGQLAHEGGVTLARLLETEITVFPGDHGGFAGKPDEFAARLLAVLDQT